MHCARLQIDIPGVRPICQRLWTLSQIKISILGMSTPSGHQIFKIRTTCILEDKTWQLPQRGKTVSGLKKHWGSFFFFSQYGLNFATGYEGGWLFSRTNWSSCDRGVVCIGRRSLLYGLINWNEGTRGVGTEAWLALKLANSSRSCYWVCSYPTRVGRSCVTMLVWAWGEMWLLGGSTKLEPWPSWQDSYSFFLSTFQK